MADPDLPTRIRARFEERGVGLADRELAALGAYFGLLTKWNKTVNLTSVVLEPASDAAIDRLLVEPAMAARYIGDTDGFLIDLGSGGGSPAIPLKVARPGLKLLMIESRTRKSAFLREAVRLLDLADAEVLNERIEEAVSRPDLREAASLVSIRAVRADRELWDSVAALLAPGGRALWFRTASDDRRGDFAPFEIEAIHGIGITSELVVLRSTEDTEESEGAERRGGG